jgi:D-cysteine desulfhydrase
MAVGALVTGFDGEVLGISIDESLDALRDSVAAIATETARLIGLNRTVHAADIRADANYLGGGYGVMGKGEREAIELFAWHEGILLDPVYTGRAAAGMIDMIRRREITKDEVVLFWHTGGTPALFAYSEQLLA